MPSRPLAPTQSPRFPCERGVLIGDAAVVVGGEGQLDAIVADHDVGVVTGRFGECGDAIDEGDGLDEVGEDEGLADLVVGGGPAGEPLQGSRRDCQR